MVPWRCCWTLQIDDMVFRPVHHPTADRARWSLEGVMNSSSETMHRSISFREPFPSDISDKLRTFLNAVSGPASCHARWQLATGGQTSQGPARVRAVLQRWIGWMRFRISILFVAVGWRSLLPSFSLSDDIRHRSKSITRSRGCYGL